MYERRFDLAFNSKGMRVEGSGCVEREYDLGFTKDKLVSVKKVFAQNTVVKETAFERILRKVTPNRILGTIFMLGGAAIGTIAGCLDVALLVSAIGLALIFA